MEAAKPVQISAQTPTDQDLVTACLAGDSKSWERLLRRYERMIYSVPARFKFDIEERRDIFQTVCCEILKNLPRLTDMAKLRHWILTITIRECNHAIRTKYRNRRHDSETLALHLKDPNADTLEIYLRTEREQLLREVFMELPDRCRRLLDMLFLGDAKVPYENVGKQLGLSKETIGSLRQRCLKSLRQLVESKDL